MSAPAARDIRENGPPHIASLMRATARGRQQAMQFVSPLIPATLIRRYKRFLADVVLARGEEITVHVANPGAMTGLALPGSRIFLSKSPGVARKLAYSWELVEVDLGSGRELVGVNTSAANRLAADALAASRIPALAGYASTRREVSYGQGCRVDYLLEGPNRPPCYVEVKNVHLMRERGLAEFPDSVTARGTRHLEALAAVAEAGARAVMLFIVQIGSSTRFCLARDIDRRYAASFDRARSRGVEAMAWRCEVTKDGIAITNEIPILEP
jgi:sugar fermentation stimulation protein A